MSRVRTDAEWLRTANTFDHGAQTVGTTAEQLTSTATEFTRGITIKAATGNTDNVYIGNSDVTADTTDATGGFVLDAGEEITLPLYDASKIYIIGGAASQAVSWIGA